VRVAHPASVAAARTPSALRKDATLVPDHVRARRRPGRGDNSRDDESACEYAARASESPAPNNRIVSPAASPAPMLVASWAPVRARSLRIDDVAWMERDDVKIAATRQLLGRCSRAPAASARHTAARPAARSMGLHPAR
jgi:hypothetical protein